MTRLEALLQRASGTYIPIPDVPAVRDAESVPGAGPMDARIVILGESPAYDEVIVGRPFVGRAGQKLRTHMRLAGINLNTCRMEYVYPLYPEGGSIDKLDSDLLRGWQANTLERLRACRQTVVIVCLGNIALETCTGLRDITRRRGSVYEWEGKKVLGMISPAALLSRGGGHYVEKMCRLDWERVKRLATSHETHDQYCGCARRIARQHIVPIPSEVSAKDGVTHEAYADSIRRYLQMVQVPSNVLALDIETPRMEGRRQIFCVSFAFSPEESLVLPWPEHTQAIRSLCESPCIKVGHNIVSFDRWWLAREGITMGGEIRDTLAVHHCLDPASPHSLEFLASRYTFEPWYKDEGKGHDIALIVRDTAGYYAYCGLDSCVTVELHHLLWPELQRRGLLDFYRRHYEALYDPILDVMREGVAIDHTYRMQLLEELLTDARMCRDRLGDINGSPLFTLGTKKDQAIFDVLTAGGSLDAFQPTDIEAAVQRIGAKTVSNAQLKTLLYEKLGLPLQMRRRKGNVETSTTDTVALRKLRLQYAENPDVAEVLDLAMRHNKVQKLATFLYPHTFDAHDGRFRFTLKLNTEAGRLASSAAPDGLGRNSQNTSRDKRLRRTILPDTGHVWVECDLSQVEGRIVFVRTKDPNLITLARDRYADQHSYTASLITGKPQCDVGKGTDERQTAKSANHAAMRCMQGKPMADTMLRQGIVHSDGALYDDDECESILESYHKVFPGIRLWQQGVRRELRATRRLINRWGFVWDVRYEELNEELYRKGYNLYPQSENAHLTNLCGFTALSYWLKGRYTHYAARQNVHPSSVFQRWNHDTPMKSRVRLQEHDSLVVSCAPDEAYDVALFLKEHLEVELEYDGVSLSVPASFKCGLNWGDTIEWDDLPSRQVVETHIANVLRPSM